MTYTVRKTSFSAGELSPKLHGMTDFAKVLAGASVLRNMYVSTKGGVHSRGGLANVGRCLQAGTSANPPRNIKFKFSATQQFILEFSHLKMRIVSNGAYVTESPFSITGATQASPCVIDVPGHNYSVGDWISVSGVNGMVNLNGRVFIISAISGNFLTLQTILNINVNSSAYSAWTSGGQTARIYTVTSPYADVDLPWLKYVQSVDVMTFGCLNQNTGTSYPLYDLNRSGATNWAFAQLSMAESIAAPQGLVVQQTSTGTAPDNTWNYTYCATAVDGDGRESLPSNSATVVAYNTSELAATNLASWQAVSNAAYYNVYRAYAALSVEPPPGSLFGFVQQAIGTSITDANITPDYSVTPPLHRDPTAPGQILYATLTAAGSAYNQNNVTVTINTSTGSGAILQAIVSPNAQTNGSIVSILVLVPGKNYQPTDTITISGTTGSGATATLDVGPLTGTYPSVVTYHQERFWTAFAPNTPDTYNASKPGDYSNFDISLVSQDGDAISGSPWSQTVDGIQWLISMPGSLLAATTEELWQVTGSGGAYAPITPSQQFATIQQATGFSQNVAPFRVDWHLVYVQYGGKTVRQLNYNYWANVFNSVDISFQSEHLFDAYTVNGLCWAYEPEKTAWAFRNDGKFMSLAYLPEQDVIGWGRHDTLGSVFSMESVNEGGLDVVYAIVQRNIDGQNWYFQERMDPRLWASISNCFCVDAGRSATISGSPISVITNADHLEGQTNIAAVIDGVDYAGLTCTGGQINLPVSASNFIYYGLPFTAQVQPLHAQVQNAPSVQAKRKRISTATARVYKTFGIQFGANEPIPSYTDSQAEVAWTNLQPAVSPPQLASLGMNSLFTGDLYANIDDDWSMPTQEAAYGMVGLQQSRPYPMSVMSLDFEIEIGDDGS